MAATPIRQESDLQRKRAKRHDSAAVVIDPVADPSRRELCLGDPERFLRTYNANGERGFTRPFAVHHQRMIDAIYQRAVNGGDKAVAAPRGDGKTTVATWMLIYIFMAQLVTSAAIIAATGKHARKIFRWVKEAFLFNDLLAGDFPEVSCCVRDLDGAPQRASKQHVDGVKTRIIWTQDEVSLPYVPGSPYGGVRLSPFGLDAAIRGGRFQFALIDDPETKAVADNEEINRELESKLDGDIAGLAFPDATISRVVLTTPQNRRSLSWRITDPQQRPTFGGERYGVLTAWPTNRDKWEEYVAIRQKAQAAGDKDGLPALDMYLANRDEMDAGHVVSNPYRFDHRPNADGRQVEVSALQAFFNRVADWGLSRVMAELQCDPDEEEMTQTLTLTPGKVQSRISGLMQHELPRQDDIIITCGADISNFGTYWVKVAWFGNATGVVIDYGYTPTINMVKDADAAFLLKWLVPTLHQWRTDILSQNPPSMCLIDSGSGLHKEAVYEFVRQVGGTPFAASKGASRFHLGKKSDTRICFDECYAEYQGRAENIWLYMINTEHWKQWVHERFTTPTFDEAHQFHDGSLSLFSDPDPKRHSTIAHQITAEERREIFVPGKGLVRQWFVKSKQNHYLDAISLAAAAAGVRGVRLVRRESLEAAATPSRPRAGVVFPKGAPVFNFRRNG